MAAAGITFEQAKRELREISGRYEADLISVGEWCEGVHDVLVRFQAGRAEAPVDAAPSAAVAPPRVADPAQVRGYSQADLDLDTYRGNRRHMTGQGA